MGIYLGQLPPTEIARLKAELAETIIANLCYPRFFDYRSNSLRMRPVDRAKRQEVWLYLSSIDFTTWSRVDLMAPEFQRHIERLFIQFVQRNRSFFGEQGRKRMSDVRMLIGTSAVAVTQGLRGHITGQRQNGTPFGSPRPAVLWSSTSESAAVTWEQVAEQTMQLQQQLQELRGEVKAEVKMPAPAEVRSPNGSSRRSSRAQPGAVAVERGDQVAALSAPPAVSPAPPASHLKPVAQQAVAPAASATTVEKEDQKSTSPLAPSPVRSTPPVASVSSPARRQNTPSTPRESNANQSPTPHPPVARDALPLVETVQSPVTVPPVEQRQHVAPRSQPAVGTRVEVGDRSTSASMMLRAGEDDVAIFEQMRHQLLVWLKVEVVRSGVDSVGQDATQLMAILRQQQRADETHLQVISTLLRLCDQVIKNGQVSLLDYKQALMFQLMHTRPL